MSKIRRNSGDGKPKHKSNNKNPERKNNAISWSKFTNCNLYKLFNFPDQKLDTVPRLKLVKVIEKAIEKIKPNIVYIHHPGDINYDHQVAAQVVLNAIRPMSYHKIFPEIRAFETPSSTDQTPKVENYLFKPNFYVSIDKFWDFKKESLKIYSSRNKKISPS